MKNIYFWLYNFAYSGGSIYAKYFLPSNRQADKRYLDLVIASAMTLIS